MQVIKSITSPLEERKCDDLKQKSVVKYEMETNIKDEIKTEVKKEVKTEQYATSIPPFLFYQVKSNTCNPEMKTERPSLPPVNAETLDQKPAVVGCDLHAATKTERKRPFTSDSKPASARRVKRKTNTEASDVILTTYSLIWRDLSELQKKNFGGCYIRAFEDMYMCVRSAVRSACAAFVDLDLATSLSSVAYLQRLECIAQIFYYIIRDKI